MICSIEENNMGYVIQFPDGSSEEVIGTEEAEFKIGAAMIAGLGKTMPAKLTLPIQSVGPGADPDSPDSEGPAKFDLKGAKTLSDLEDRVGNYVQDNAVALGRKGLGKLQKVCKDKHFRGRRRFAS